MITPLQQTMLDKGYTRHQSPSISTFHKTDILFQKCIKDSLGKKYFINLYYYPETHFIEQVLKEAIQPEIDFYLPDDESFQVICGFKDIDKIEQFCEDMFSKFKCTHYELYNSTY